MLRPIPLLFSNPLPLIHPPLLSLTMQSKSSPSSFILLSNLPSHLSDTSLRYLLQPYLPKNSLRSILLPLQNAQSLGIARLNLKLSLSKLQTLLITLQRVHLTNGLLHAQLDIGGTLFAERLRSLFAAEEGAVEETPQVVQIEKEENNARHDDHQNNHQNNHQHQHQHQYGDQHGEDAYQGPKWGDVVVRSYDDLLREAIERENKRRHLESQERKKLNRRRALRHNCKHLVVQQQQHPIVGEEDRRNTPEGNPLEHPQQTIPTNFSNHIQTTRPEQQKPHRQSPTNVFGSTSTFAPTHNIQNKRPNQHSLRHRKNQTTKMVTKRTTFEQHPHQPTRNKLANPNLTLQQKHRAQSPTTVFGQSPTTLGPTQNNPQGTYPPSLKKEKRRTHTEMEQEKEKEMKRRTKRARLEEDQERTRQKKMHANWERKSDTALQQQKQQGAQSPTSLFQSRATFGADGEGMEGDSVGLKSGGMKRVRMLGDDAMMADRCGRGRDEQGVAETSSALQMEMPEMKSVACSDSRIHGTGLFAMQGVGKGEFVIEYGGQRGEKRDVEGLQEQYERMGISESYIFELPDGSVIDGTLSNSLARYINHSCDPNLKAFDVNMGGEYRVMFYAVRDVAPREELTCDYMFELEDEEKKIGCLCGARMCQQFLNFDPYGFRAKLRKTQESV